MKKTVFIISTQNYPKQDDDKWSVAFRQSIKLKSLDQKLRNERNVSDFYKNNGCIIKHQHLEGSEFYVYVAPCLYKYEEECIRFSYLNNIIDQVYQQMEKNGESELDVFLIAHDKDFGVDKDDAVATIVVPDDYGRLIELRKNYHIFLFQHEDGVIFDHVKLLSRIVEPIFNIDTCVELLGFLNKKIAEKKR